MEKIEKREKSILLDAILLRSFDNMDVSHLINSRIAHSKDRSDFILGKKHSIGTDFTKM